MEFFALIFLGAFLFVWAIVVAAMLLFKVRRPGPYLIAVGVAILVCAMVQFLVDMYYARFP